MIIRDVAAYVALCWLNLTISANLVLVESGDATAPGTSLHCVILRMRRIRKVKLVKGVPRYYGATPEVVSEPTSPITSPITVDHPAR